MKIKYTTKTPPSLVELYLSTLEDEEIRERALYLHREYKKKSVIGYKDSMNNSVHIYSVGTALDWAFEWANTDEGWDFWENLQKHYTP